MVRQPWIVGGLKGLNDAISVRTLLLPPSVWQHYTIYIGLRNKVLSLIIQRKIDEMLVQ